MQYGLSIVVLLLLTAPAHAQTAEQWQTEDRIFHVAMGAYAFASGWDAKNTKDCVRLGLCQEANPIYRPLVERHGIGVAMGVKLAGSAAIAGVLLWQRPKHRKLTAIALGTVASLQLYVDYRNYRTLQRVGLR